MLQVEAGLELVGVGEGYGFRVLVEGREEGEGDGRAGAAVVGPVVVFCGGEGWGVGAAEAVGNDDGGLAAEVGGGELRASLGATMTSKLAKSWCMAVRARERARSAWM